MALAAYYASVSGVIATTYMLEIVIAILAWRALLTAQNAIENPERSSETEADPVKQRTA
ncbi:hypothetical protein D3C87_1731650 [compost metagenome]